MNTNKRFMMVLAMVLVLSMTTSAFAANMDIYNVETGKVYKYNDFIADDAMFNDVLNLLSDDAGNYVYEYGGKGYNFEALNENFGKTNNLAEALKDTPEVELPKEEEPVVELKVIEVSAITESVASGVTTKQEVGFTINNGKEVTLAELTEAGYTVEFLATKDVFKGTPATSTSATGVLNDNLTATTDNFSYKVTITKGEEVIESELQAVKVQDFSKAVTEITESTVLFDTDVKLTSGTVVAGETVVIKDIKGYKKDAPATEITLQFDDVTVKSSDVTKAIPSLNGSGAAEVTLTLPGVTGNVAITIKAGDVEHVVNLNVVSEAREISATNSTVDTTPVKLANSKTKNVAVVLKDQYGDLVKGSANNIDAASVKNANSEEIATTSAVQTDNEGKAAVVVTADTTKVGSGNLVLKSGTTTLGTVPVVVAEAGDVAYRTVEIASDSKSDDYELDVNTTPTDDSELKVFWNKYNDSDILIGAENSTDYTVASSKTSVATVAYDDTSSSSTGAITVSAAAAGTTTITIKEGAITKASFDVTVVDTTPAVETIALAEGVTEIEIASDATGLEFSNIASNFVVKDQFGEDITPEKTDVTYLTDDATVLNVSTANEIAAASTPAPSVGDTANLILKVNGKVISVPVVIVAP